MALEDDSADTVPLTPVKDDEFSFGEDYDKLPEDVKERVPEPALVRGVIMAVVGLVGAVIGKQIHADWVDPAIALYVLVAPIGLSLWIRRHVTPVPKT